MGKKSGKPAAVRSGAAVWPLLAIAAAFVHGAAASWHKLGFLLVDNGRELELPRRLLEGAQLYADARYYWGPLAPALSTLLYRVFGVSIDTLRNAGLFSAALMCAGLYLVSRHFLGRWTSAAVAIAFVYLGAFAHLMAFPIFNFVLPFNFSATWGIVLALFSLHLLLVHQRTGAAASFLGASVLFGLAALTKLEILFAAGAAHAAFALTTGKALRRVHFGGWALALAIPAATYGALYARVGPALWHENLGALLSPASRHYVQRTMGLLSPAESLQAIGLSVSVFAALAAVCWAVARKPAPAAQVALGAAIFGGFAWLNPDIPTRSWVVLLGLGLALALRNWWHARGGEAPVPHAQRVVLFAFALACVARIVFRAIPSHYGFYLLPPGLICLAVLVVDALPVSIGASPRGRPVFAVAALALLLGMGASGYRASHPWYAVHNLPLTTPRGDLDLIANSSEPFLLKTLAGFRPGTRVVTVPQGAGLIFASGLSAGDQMFSYLPMEIPDPEADARLRAQWEKQPPEVIVWWRLPLETSFGVKGFGVDYAQQSGKWVERNYRPVTDAQKDFVVLVRNVSAATP